MRNSLPWAAQSITKGSPMTNSESVQDDLRQERLQPISRPAAFRRLKWSRSGHVHGRFERLTTKAPGFAGGYLLLSSVAQHCGYAKRPSVFLGEMGFER